VELEHHSGAGGSRRRRGRWECEDHGEAEDNGRTRGSRRGRGRWPNPRATAEPRTMAEPENSGGAEDERGARGSRRRRRRQPGRVVLAPRLPLRPTRAMAQHGFLLSSSGSTRGPSAVRRCRAGASGRHADKERAAAPAGEDVDANAHRDHRASVGPRVEPEDDELAIEADELAIEADELAIEDDNWRPRTQSGVGGRQSGVGG